MAISRDQAKRWDLVTDGFATPRLYHTPLEDHAQLIEDREKNARAQLGDWFSAYDTNPSIDRLIKAYQQHMDSAHEHEVIARAMAVHLMTDHHISVSELSRELGISRPTLYAWQREAGLSDHND